MIIDAKDSLIQSNFRSWFGQESKVQIVDFMDLSSFSTFVMETGSKCSTSRTGGALSSSSRGHILQLSSKSEHFLDILSMESSAKVSQLIVWTCSKEGSILGVNKGSDTLNNWDDYESADAREVTYLAAIVAAS